MFQIPDLAARLVLGTDSHQRLRLTRTLTAAGVFAICLLVQWHSVRAGYAEARASLWLTVFIVAGQLLVYTAIRGGHVLDLADPALTMPQMVFALSALALAYRIDAPVRGILLMVVALVLVFGAFTLTPRRCRALGWAAMGLFGTAMAWGALYEPERFDPGIELIHFFFALAVLPTISFLSGELSQLRIDLQRQKRDLRNTLATLRTLAAHDELTGLPNRRHAKDWLRHETAKARRSGQTLSMALIDLDHFKQVNDSLGHAVGDEVLRTFAHHARALLREGDLLARWGGEEFLLVMPGAGQAQAEHVLARLRERLGQPLVWVNCSGARVTFSAGLVVQDTWLSLEQLFRCADEALYAAKDAGRNCTRVAPLQLEPA